MDKVIRDGLVAVLVSPGFGAGWSTWADNKFKEWATFSPSVVAWVESGKVGGMEAVENIAMRELGSDHPYLGGAMDLEIEWLPVGSSFRIDEYDGSESLELSYEARWMQA